MTGMLIIGIILLIGIIVVQIGRVSDLAARIRGEEEMERRNNNTQAAWGMIFMVGFLIFCIVSAIYYKNDMLGYGPHASASEHGGRLDSLFNMTLFFTGIVFVLTHIVLFWFTLLGFFFRPSHFVALIIVALQYADSTFVYLNFISYSKNENFETSYFQILSFVQFFE